MFCFDGLFLPFSARGWAFSLIQKEALTPLPLFSQQRPFSGTEGTVGFLCAFLCSSEHSSFSLSAGACASTFTGSNNSAGDQAGRWRGAFSVLSGLLAANEQSAPSL